MVKLMGHLAMGLLWAAPAWLVWDGRVSLAFVGFVLSTVMLPDVDLVLQGFVPGVEHHGVTHTVLFVTVVAVVVGVLAVRAGGPLLGWGFLEREVRRARTRTAYLFVTGGLLLGGLSHLFADVLSAPDVAQPVEPLWPLVNSPISVDVVYYSSIWWNLGLLLVATAVHLVLAYLDVRPLGDVHRLGEP